MLEAKQQREQYEEQAQSCREAGVGDAATAHLKAQILF